MAQNGRRGFTLAEMIAVICIIAVLLAVAFPSANYLISAHSLRALDSAAKDIYLSMQNSLAYINARGGSEGARELFENSGDFLILEEKSLAGCPGLYGESIKDIVGGGAAVLCVDGREITGVFYSKELSGDDLVDICRGLENRSFGERLKLRLGYYGGDSAGALMPRKYNDPKIDVLNGEELVLKITGEIDKKYTREEVSLEVKLISDSAEVTLNIDDFSYINGRVEAEILLDKTLSDSGSEYLDRFESRLGRSGLIYAQAKIIHRRGGELTDCITAESEKFSPLYGDIADGVIEISCARHLNNLRFSGGEIDVLQTENIDLSALPCSFAPLPELFGSFDGNGRFISGLSVSGEHESAGLFSKISGSVKNIHVTGARISANGGSAGVIAGELDGSAENCSADGCEIAAGVDACAGGIAGSCKGRIVNCSAEVNIYLSSGSSAGGIAGNLEGSAISCRAAGFSDAEAGAENVKMAGIAAAGSGKIESCLSERSLKHAFGAEISVFGPTEAEISGCKFVRENGWLFDGETDAIGESELENAEIAGFTVTDLSLAVGESRVGRKTPECVTAFGRAAHFGDFVLADPRGTVGAARAEYSGGRFEVALLTAFDAYGNNFAGVPEIKWEDPADGEVRYYIFTQTFTYPGRGESGGWNAVFDIEGAELEAAEVFGEYFAMRISGAEAGGRAELSFGEETRSFEIEAEAEEIAEYKIGVFACRYSTGVYQLDDYTFDVGPHYEWTSCIYDISNDTNDNPHNGYALSCGDIGITAPKEKIVYLYIAVSKGLKPDTDWKCSVENTYAGTENGYDCYLVKIVDFSDPRNRKTQETVDLDLELMGHKYNIRVTIEKNASETYAEEVP